MAPDDERALVARVSAGDTGAFDEVRDYRSRAFAFLLRISRNRALAEDLLDETWLRLVRHATRLLPDTRLGPWLFTRLQILLALLDLRRGQPKAAVDRIRAAAEKTPESIEVLLTRAEIETFAGAADAPDDVASLLPRAADGLFHNAPYPVRLAHAYHLFRRGATLEAGKILDGILTANQRALADRADWPVVFMQNAAVHALQDQRAGALDDLDRAYAAGWRDGRTLAIDPFFTTIRADPRFTQLLSRIASDVAAMRARADMSGL